MADGVTALTGDGEERGSGQAGQQRHPVGANAQASHGEERGSGQADSKGIPFA